MSRERLAAAYDALAEASAQIAHELRGIEPAAPPAVQDRVPSRPAAAEAGVPPAPASAPLGVCPKHRIAWTVKEGGISKNGKPYKAFWKCSTKDEDGYCNEKPERSWAATHDAEAALMDQEVPF